MSIPTGTATPFGGITSAYRQERSRTDSKPKISGLFQPTIFGPKAKQQVEAYTRSEQTKSFPQVQNLQEKIQSLLLLPACPVRQFMFLIGLLTTYETHTVGEYQNH